jgi:hypothetical protein
MASSKNTSRTIMALAVSGGIWAWQNRDKISGWLKQQQAQMQQPSTTTSQTPSRLESTGQPYTDATRRINESDISSQPGFNARIISSEKPS